MWNKLKKKFKGKKYLAGLQVFVALVLVLSAVLVGTVNVKDIANISGEDQFAQTIGFNQKVIVIGNEAHASSTPDYITDGVADDVQFQLALNALPASGGKLVILGGTYTLAVAVTRAIDNVTIEGMGRSTFISRDGVNPNFTTGVQSDWTFRNIRFDAGGVNDTGASHVIYENVYIGATYYAFDTSADVTGGEWDIPVGRGATLIVAASDASAQSIAQADYWADGTDDEVEIQAAIDALEVIGGGEVRLTEGLFIIEGVPPAQPQYSTIIVLKENVSIVGSGSATILKLVDGYNDNTAGIIGNSEWPVTYGNIRIANLKIDGNKANTALLNAAIFLAQSDDFIVEGVLIVDCDGSGIQLQFLPGRAKVMNNTVLDSGIGIYVDQGTSGKGRVISGNVVKDNVFANIWIDYSSYNTVTGNISIGSRYGIELTRSSSFNTIVGNAIDSATSDGIIIDAEIFTGFGIGAQNNIISGNTIYNSGTNGIRIINTPSTDPAVAQNDYNIITDNTITRSGRHGISLVSDNNLISDNLIYESSSGTDVTYDGIYLDAEADYNVIINNVIRQGALANQPRYGINISAASNDNNIVRGNDLYDSGQTANLSDSGTLTHIEDNRGTEITDERVFVQVKNTSGGQLDAGDVVILKAVAAGNEITTTAAQGNDLVFGMVAETIADNATGLVLIKGKTTVLKVDGTADVDIGDFIGTFTVVKIGMEAAAGDMAFAIALEAYAANDSNGVIDALLITPRKI